MKEARFNIIDAIAILGIAGLIAVGAWFFTNLDTGENVTVYFTVEIREREDGFADLIEVGDEIRDAVRNYFLGHVHNVEVRPTEIITFDQDNQAFIYSRIPERYDVWLTVRGVGTETASAIATHGQEVRVGQEVFLRGRGYAGLGFIVNLRTEAN